MHPLKTCVIAYQPRSAGWRMVIANQFIKTIEKWYVLQAQQCKKTMVLVVIWY
jgi:hypothetical protein